MPIDININAELICDVCEQQKLNIETDGDSEMMKDIRDWGWHFDKERNEVFCPDCTP